MQKRGRGRPRFKPTPAHRRMVEQMVSCGESRERIARAIGISVPTLTEHFADNLEHGLSRRRNEVIELLFKAARKGNVTAQKQLAAMTGAALVDKAVADMGANQETPSRAAKQGKKELAQDAAQSAGIGTEWGADLHVTGAGPVRPN